MADASAMIDRSHGRRSHMSIAASRRERMGTRRDGILHVMTSIDSASSAP